MNKSPVLYKTKPKALMPKKNMAMFSHTMQLALMITLLLAGSLLFISCSKPSSDTFQPKETPAGTSSEAAKPEPAKEKAVLGVIKVQKGAMLERDIIPQLCKVFSLTEDKVKETLAAASSSNLKNPKLTDFRRMEGMILPGEYVITEGSTLQEKVSTWILESEKRYSTLLSSNGNPNNLSALQQLTLASMVEAECLGNAHHEETATVFLNRLADGSKLQSCVTAEYAIGYQRPYLLTSDIAAQSDYNTYYVKGLPVGPICSIGDASLKAAISKKMDKRIYYFFYDYIKNDMFFFTDYATFLKEGNASRANFEQKSSVGKRDKINKQALYSKNIIEGSK